MGLHPGPDRKEWPYSKPDFTFGRGRVTSRERGQEKEKVKEKERIHELDSLRLVLFLGYVTANLLEE